MDDGVKVNFDGKTVIDRPRYSYQSIIDRKLLLGLKTKNYTINNLLCGN